MRGWLAYLRSLWHGIRRPAELDAEMSDEMRFHLDMEAQRFMRRGLDATEAHRQAALAFGGVEKYRGAGRDALGFTWLRGLSVDFKLGLRMLARYPGLTVVAVLGMSVAIAITAGAYTIIDGMLTSQLPLHEGDRIVAIQNWDTQASLPDRRSVHDFVAWRREIASVDDIGAFRLATRNLISPGAPPELVTVAEISASGFRVARVAPLLGRYLLDTDEHAGAEPVVVIGHDVWRSRFGGRADIVGQPLQLGPVTYAIAGVMPEGFTFPVSHQYWIPLVAEPAGLERRQGPELYVFGRLAAGVTMRTAQTEVTGIGERTAASFPATHAHLRPQVVPYTYPFSDMDDPDNVFGVRLMQVLASLLLGLVCVNVSILIYARTATRQSEMAVRTALGAGRLRIVGQLFIEALALAGASALLAFVLIALGMRQVDAAMIRIAGSLPFWMTFELSAGAVMNVLLLAVAAAALVGVAPALKVTGRRVHSGLTVRSGSSHGQLGRAWTALVVVQVAVAVAVLPSAVSYAWTTATYASGDAGFPATQVLSARLVMEASTGASASIAEPQFRARFADRQRQLAQRLAGEPRVAGVAYALTRTGLEAGGVITTDDATAEHEVRLNRVGDGWFETLDIPLVAGRGFTTTDAIAGADVVIVNESFVKDVLGGANAIGRRVRYARLRRDVVAGSAAVDRWYDIVGVARDILARSERGAVNASIYHPLAAGAHYPVSIDVRLHGRDPLEYAGTLRAIGTAVDPDLQLRGIEVADDFLRQEEGLFRVIAAALGLLAIAVVFLSAAGIYALISCTVEQRRKDIGIRTALGADARRIFGAIFARALWQLGTGAAIGVGIATLLANGPEGELMPGRGAVIVPLVSALMVVAGLAAAWNPARRALRADPIDTLRAE